MEENKKIILEFSHITKKFPGVKALSDITFSVEKGMVYALIGENGAGKSTLMKVLTGAYLDYQGQIKYKGREVHFSNEKEALDNGIDIVNIS